jgi:hypothetical protein
MYARGHLLDRLSDDLVEQFPVAGGAEYRLAMVASQGDMIEAARDVEAERARHGKQHL